jgi:hypothetical protein
MGRFTNAERCGATNKRGEPCGAPAGEIGFCAIHANPALAKELGAKGGRKNRHIPQDEPREQMSAPADVSEVRLALGRMMADVHNGIVSTKTATCVTYISMALLKAMEVSDLETRLKRLEDLADGAAKKN